MRRDRLARAGDAETIGQMEAEIVRVVRSQSADNEISSEGQSRNRLTRVPTRHYIPKYTPGQNMSLIS